MPDNVPAEKVTEDYPFHSGYKVIEFKPKYWPPNATQWARLIWGTDLWFGPVPLIKIMIVLNLAMWALMWGTR